VFWLSKPPYVRWLAAAAVVLAAVAWDLSGRRMESFPFAAVEISAGRVIDSEDIEWRDVPTGLMPLPDLSQPTTSRHVTRGEPITASAVSSETSIPDGWWAIPVALPAIAVSGAMVRLVVVESGFSVDGIVVAASERDLLSLADAGLVAVPGDAAETVARAAADGGVTVLVRP
jgi:hypothetical protein